MRITKKDQLQKIRAEVQDSLYAPGLLKMNIGMATCGIAAGAKDVYDKAREIFEKQDVLVARTGCLGLCEEEPLVDIQAPGQPRIVYRRVSADKVMELVEAHQKAEYVEKAILGQMKDPFWQRYSDLGRNTFLQQTAQDSPEELRLHRSRKH
jgi:NADP-reducing hydrogenase subunit HndB